MKILDRLILGSFLRLFLMATAAMPILFIVGDITENLNGYLDSGLTLPQILIGLAYKVPEFVSWAFPIAGLIAAVFTIHSMTTHREIVAAKAGGISFHRLLVPILLLGLGVAGVGLWLAEYVPKSNRIAVEILRNEAISSQRDWRVDFVFRTESGMDLAARRLSAREGTLTGILATWTEDDGTVMHMEAEGADWVEGEWHFRNGRLRAIGPTGAESLSRFDRFVYLPLQDTPDDLLSVPRDADELTREEIERQARIIRRAGGDPAPELVKLEQRLAIPAATLVIILFGAPLATSNRRGGAAYGIGVSLASTLFYLVLMRVSAAFGNSGLVDPLYAAWSPNVIFLLLGLILLSRVRT